MAKTGKSIKMEKVFVDKFNNDPLYRNKINNLLGGDYDYAEDCKSGLLTEEWQKLSGKNGKDPSKSDVTLSGSSGIIGVSIKNGGGRATSANYSETKAIFYTVLNQSNKYVGDKVLNNLIDDMFNTWKPYDKKYVTDKEVTTRKLKQGKIKEAQLQAYIDVCTPLTAQVKQILAHNKDYMVDVMRECLTGFNKFGDDFARADFYLQTAKDNVDKVDKLYDVTSKNFKNVCSDYLSGNVLNFNMKSSSGGRPIRDHWIRFM